MVRFFVIFGALLILGWLFALIIGTATGDPIAAVGAFLLWAVLNQKRVLKEEDNHAHD